MPVYIAGASRGMGLELAKLATRGGCELILAVDRDFNGQKWQRGIVVWRRGQKVVRV